MALRALMLFLGLSRALAFSMHTGSNLVARRGITAARGPVAQLNSHGPRSIGSTRRPRVGVVPHFERRLGTALRLTGTEDSEPAPQGGAFPPPWLLPFLVPALGGALFGFDIGSSSAVVRILGEGASDLGQLSAIELGYVASGSLAGAMAASAALIFAGDAKIGRKQELQLASTLFAAGSALQAFAGSLPLVLVGRLVYGLGIGTAMHVAPLYIGETAPDTLRGKLVSLKEGAIVLGIVAG
jgi:hypothetical protein